MSRLTKAVRAYLEHHGTAEGRPQTTRLGFHPGTHAWFRRAYEAAAELQAAVEEQERLETSLEIDHRGQPPLGICRRCGQRMYEGQALQPYYSCSDEGTCSPSFGQAKLVPCWKCSGCGYSTT